MNRRDSDSAGFRNDAWYKSLGGALAVVAICGTLTSVCTFGGGGGRALQATIQLERLAASLDHTGSIHPDTARDLARVLALPDYDCDRIKCRAGVEARNSAVRARLITLITIRTRADTIAAWRTRVTAAGPAQVSEPR